MPNTTPYWKFNPVVPGLMNTGAFQNDMFANRGDAETLIREAIQNSIDARDESLDKPVAVRLKLSKDAVSPEKLEEMGILQTLKGHLTASVDSKYLPDFTKPASYLVIEDSRTIGLTGDPLDEEKGNFARFFRWIGESDKHGLDIGRFGLGKAVFPMASQIGAYIGLTVRKGDNKQLLMGQSTLAHHTFDCGDSFNKWTPNGWFGVFDDPAPGKDFYKQYKATPVENEAYCNDFKELFDLKRTIKEPGLSVVVLYPKEDITERAVKKAVIQEFFYAIVNRDLVVRMEDGSYPLIESQNIHQIIDGIPDEKFKASFSPIFVDFVRWAVTSESDSFYELRKPDDLVKAPGWSRVLFADYDLEVLQAKFDKGERLAFLVPLRKKESGQPPELGWFKVFLQKYDGQTGYAHFVRRGITVINESMESKEFLGLAVIDDPVLTNMLGDADNVNHTKWEERQKKFQKYENRRATLNFVRDCFQRIVNILQKPVSGIDMEALDDTFFLPPRQAKDETGTVPEEERPKRGLGAKQGPVQVTTSKPRLFKLSQIKGGFLIGKSPTQSDVPSKIKVRAAYYVRRGNPFKKYQEADFDFRNLDRSHIAIEGRNYEAKPLTGNAIEFEITGDPFEIRVTGFDMYRDLIVDAKPQRDGNETEV